MSQPWKSATPPSSSFSLSNYTGCLAFFVVGGYHQAFPLVNAGPTPAVRAGVVILDGPRAGEEIPDALLFAVKVVGQLKDEPPGTIILGRIAAEPGRGNNQMYSIDTMLTPADDQLAGSWFAAFPHRLTELGQIALTNWQGEEHKHGGRAAPTTPPGPGRPPAPPQWGQPPAAPPPPPMPPAPPAQSPSLPTGTPPWAPPPQPPPTSPWGPAAPLEQPPY